VEAKPRQIKWFVVLQCASLGLGALKLPINWTHLTGRASVVSLVFVLGFTTALIGFLTWKVTQGRNWARITLLVLFLIGVLPFAYNVRSEFARSVSLATISIVQAALQGLSLALVFTSPVKECFRGVAAKPHIPEQAT
jgi:hypothetical protein